MNCDELTEGKREGAVHAVVVTYGDRAHLLSRTLASLAREPDIVAITVVNNGSTADLPSVLPQFNARIQMRIEALARNEGSAAGFGLGMKSAADSGIGDFVLVLDDDNCICPGGVRRLLKLHAMLGTDGTKSALSCLREGRFVYESLLRGRGGPQVVENSCLDFHVQQIPSRLLRRILGKHAGAGSRANPSRLIELQYAPYGGLFIPSPVLRSNDGPDQSYVLYSDDNEFTARLILGGVKIYLTDLVVIDDIDASWSEGGGRHNVWVGRGAAPWRVYYSARNRLRFEQMFVRSPLAYAVNRWVIFSIFTLQAILEHRSYRGAKQALLPLRDAWRDYSEDRYGMCASYSLPFGRAQQTSRNEQP